VIEGTVDIKRYTDEDMIIVGTVDQCLEKILRYADAGVDHLLSYQQFGMLPHEKVMRSIELLGTQVIPELERRGHRVDYGTLLTSSA
jgi:alkanesulfonate monooxygenase SsuD/methylene tetrahydromethanopterin reductase-like flavin-dependent oxidoreductase (luciferase family)